MASASAVRPLLELIGLRSFLPSTCACRVGERQFLVAAGLASSTSSTSSTAGEAAERSSPPAADTKHRSATETIWPASKHQERFAARLQNALSTALLKNDGLRDTLVQQLGFAVKEVRMSPDNLKAFILWDSFVGQPTMLERELQKQTPKLRAAVAKALGARNMPRLVFKHDGLTEKQQEVEDIFQRLEEEEEDVQQQQQGGQQQDEQDGLWRRGD